jgi:membrane associated rhomboid family serine protease
MAINVLTIIILITVGVSITAFNNRSLLEKLMYIPYNAKHQKDYKRMLSHVLIHADWGHLLFNMLSLYFLGNSFLTAPCFMYQDIDCGLQATYGEFGGQAHFLAIYVLGALFATLIPYIRHQDNPGYRSLGASGAVSAIIFAAILWNPGMKLMLMFIPIPIPAYIFGPLYLLYEYFADKRGGTGIAHDAHIGGALFGILYVLLINVDKGKEFISYFVQ